MDMQMRIGHKAGDIVLLEFIVTIKYGGCFGLTSI